MMYWAMLISQLPAEEDVACKIDTQIIQLAADIDNTPADVDRVHTAVWRL